MWMKTVLLLACSIHAVTANERLPDELWQDYQNKLSQKAANSASRTWIFNDWIYRETSAGQWISIGQKGLEGFEIWLNDLTDKGLCPKEHKGVRLDTRSYERGIWCCEGKLPNGQDCPYHVNIRFPKPQEKGP